MRTAVANQVARLLLRGSREFVGEHHSPAVIPPTINKGIASSTRAAGPTSRHHGGHTAESEG